MMSGDFLRAPLIPHSETSVEEARPLFGPLPVSDKEFIVVRALSLCVSAPSRAQRPLVRAQSDFRKLTSWHSGKNGLQFDAHVD